MEEQKSPVMDVVPPPPSAEPAASPHAQPAPPADPAGDVPKPAAHPKPTAPPKPPKSSQQPAAAPGDGTRTAIAATVVIVLGLAALATYAFLKTR